MTYTFDFVRRAARLRALMLVAVATTFSACDATDRLTSASEDPATETVDPVGPASLALSFRGGIPMGHFTLPTTQFGSLYNGGLRNIWPSALIAELSAIRARGGKVVLMFAGNERHYKDGSNHFSLTKWKERVNRFRGVNFSSFVNDGTIIAHYLIDEPNDPYNWGGRPVSGSTVEEMARYSKQLWPTIPTVARTWPAYLKGSTYRHLDGAWAQYHERFGSVETWISNNVRDAKASGLALVVGLNQLAGGTSSSGLSGYYDNGYSMSARELETWGGALLNDPYACAFLSWRHDPDYMARSDIKAAMVRLSEKARNHTSKSCRGTAGQTAGEEPEPSAEEPVGGVSPVPSSGISLNVTGWVQEGRHYMKLTWSGASGETVDLYRNGSWIRDTPNDRNYTNSLRDNGPATYRYKVCQKGTSICSNEARVDFQ